MKSARLTSGYPPKKHQNLADLTKKIRSAKLAAAGIMIHIMSMRSPLPPQEASETDLPEGNQQETNS